MSQEEKITTVKKRDTVPAGWNDFFFIAQRLSVPTTMAYKYVLKIYQNHQGASFIGLTKGVESKFFIPKSCDASRIKWSDDQVIPIMSQVFCHVFILEFLS